MARSKKRDIIDEICGPRYFLEREGLREDWKDALGERLPGFHDMNMRELKIFLYYLEEKRKNRKPVNPFEA